MPEAALKETKSFRIISVPHSESGVVPMSSLLGVGQLGFWEVGKGGTIWVKGGANRVSLQVT